MLLVFRIRRVTHTPKKLRTAVSIADSLPSSQQGELCLNQLNEQKTLTFDTKFSSSNILTENCNVFPFMQTHRIWDYFKVIHKPAFSVYLYLVLPFFIFLQRIQIAVDNVYFVNIYIYKFIINDIISLVFLQYFEMCCNINK